MTASRVALDSCGAGAGAARKRSSRRPAGPALAVAALLTSTAAAITAVGRVRAAFTGLRPMAAGAPRRPVLRPQGAAAAAAAGRWAMRATDAEALPEKWKVGNVQVYSGQAQKAMYLMAENPILFDSTVEEELELLQSQAEEEERQKNALEATTKEDTLVLRRRMDEVRRGDRMRIVTELLYLKVCRRFEQLKVPLIPPLKAGGDVKLGAVNLKGLTTDIYSADALELVRDHLFRIIGQQGSASFMGGLAVVQIALYQAGQVYAMSSLFGYYLRRVDARYQLEMLAGNFQAGGDVSPSDAGKDPFEGDEGAVQSLKDYIAGFGPQEVQRMTTIASVEAQMAMESQVTALFGDLRVLKEKLVNTLGRVRSNEEANEKLQRAIRENEVESLRITSDDLRRMVLEAVAYGALLNDSEKQVDSIYELTPSSSRPLGALTGDDEDEGRYLSG